MSAMDLLIEGHRLKIAVVAEKKERFLDQLLLVDEKES